MTCREYILNMTTESRGFSLIELMVTLALGSILLGTAVYQINDLRDPAATGAAQVVAFVKQARAKAFGTTLAYTIQPSSSTTIIAQFSKKCSSTTKTNDSKLLLTLANGATLATTNWSICFSTRGIAETSASFGITDTKSTKTVQIAAGGGARYY